MMPQGKINLETWQLVNRRQLPYDRAPDFPAIDSRLATGPYRHFWMLGISITGQPGRKFFAQLAHLDWENPTDPVQVYQPTEKGICLGCEPTFLVGTQRTPSRGWCS
jgi:carotenoid cleavage dioxygenase-like enzyme